MPDHPTIAAAPRRTFLTGSAALASAGLPGCDLLATAPEDSGQHSESPHADTSGTKEAPILARKVNTGALPPLTKRLPQQPLVLHPLRDAGRYGGTLKIITVGVDAVEGDLQRLVGYDHLVRWKSTMSTWTDEDVLPNIADSVDTNPDKTKYTFHLRPGMRWSDGKPFGTDDIVFWHRDVLSNKKLTPAVSDWLRSGEQPVVVRKIDGHTVTFSFTQTNGLLLPNLAANAGAQPTSCPAHYLKQFHPRYNARAADDAKDAGFDNWVNFFLHKSSPWENPDLPVLNAWQVTAGTGDKTQRIDAKRNPYYWKTDTNGKQLPYADAISFEISSTQQVAKLKALHGDVDFTFHSTLLTAADRPIFARTAKKSNYGIIDLKYEDANTMGFCLNLAHQDPVMRTILGNKNFRIGISYAINRSEIIDLVFQRQGEPWQVAPRHGTPYYNERLATQYTQFSVAKSVKYLNRVLPDKDSRGIRLKPDGTPFQFRVDVMPGRLHDVDVLQVIRKHLKAVGINMSIKSEGGNLFWERIDANLHDASAFASGGGLDPVLQPNFYFPDAQEIFEPGVPWTYWHRFGGMDGNISDNGGLPIEKPPPAAIKQIALYRKLQRSPDTEEQVSLMRELLAVAQEQFWCIGVCTPAKNFGIVTSRLKNVPNPMIDDWPWQTPGPTNPPQYYIN